MSAYLYILKLRLLSALNYRFEVFAYLVTNIIMLLATVFLWQTTYRGVAAVDGVAQRQMITYAILSLLLSNLFQTPVQNTIVDHMREGQIAIDLIRPFNLLLQWLADDLGAALASGVQYLIPLLVLALAFIQVPWPASLQAGLLFIPSCLLSYAILWLLSAQVGVIALWTMSLGNMGLVKDALVRALSGSIVPIWFFPSWFQAISRYLPFQYIYQTPLGIYIGKIPPDQALQAMATQVVWTVGLGLILQALWTYARKRVLVQGG